MDMVVSACSFFIFPWKLQSHCVQLSSIQALWFLAVSSHKEGWFEPECGWADLCSGAFVFLGVVFQLRVPHQAWSWGVWRGPFTRCDLPSGDSGGWWKLQHSVMKLSLGCRYWWKKFSRQILRSCIHLHCFSRRDQDIKYLVTAVQHPSLAYMHGEG